MFQPQQPETKSYDACSESYHSGHGTELLEVQRRNDLKG